MGKKRRVEKGSEKEIKKGGAGLEPKNTTSKIIMGLFKTIFPPGFAACFSLVFPRLFDDTI
jgi:hypothetical protein